MEVERNWYYMYGLYESKDELQNVIRSILSRSSHNIFVISFFSLSYFFLCSVRSSFLFLLFFNLHWQKSDIMHELSVIRKPQFRAANDVKARKSRGNYEMWILNNVWMNLKSSFIPILPHWLLTAGPLCAAIESSTQEWRKLKWGKEMKLLDGI